MRNMNTLFGSMAKADATSIPIFCTASEKACESPDIPKRKMSVIKGEIIPLPTRIRKDFEIRFRLQSPSGDYSGDYSGKTILIITHSYISGTPSV